MLSSSKSTKRSAKSHKECRSCNRKPNKPHVVPCCFVTKILETHSTCCYQCCCFSGSSGLSRRRPSLENRSRRLSHLRVLPSGGGAGFQRTNMGTNDSPSQNVAAWNTKVGEYVGNHKMGHVAQKLRYTNGCEFARSSTNPYK